jgi:hypothetical protein
MCVCISPSLPPSLPAALLDLGVPPLLLLYVYAAVSVAVHTQYWVSVVREIAGFLKIRIFHIKSA